MALRMGALYDALRQSSEITEDQARAAAEEVAGYDSRMSVMQRDLAVLKGIGGTLIALTLLVLGVVLSMNMRVATLEAGLNALSTRLATVEADVRAIRAAVVK